MSLRGHYKTTTASVQVASFLVVRIGPAYFALPSEGVRGVLTSDESSIAQTVLWVGVTYHEISLAGLLGRRLDRSNPDMRTVLYSSRHSHGAIRVDEVIGLIDVERSLCRTLPPQFRGEERSWIVGTLLHQDHVVLILNPEWVLGELGEVVAIGAKPDPRGTIAAAGGEERAC
jgi:chemotaxis signal transduction protein